jgi:hypothetical protein
MPPTAQLALPPTKLPPHHTPIPSTCCSIHRCSQTWPRCGSPCSPAQCAARRLAHLPRSGWWTRPKVCCKRACSSSGVVARGGGNQSSRRMNKSWQFTQPVTSPPQHDAWPMAHGSAPPEPPQHLLLRQVAAILSSVSQVDLQQCTEQRDAGRRQRRRAPPPAAAIWQPCMQLLLPHGLPLLLAPRGTAGSPQHPAGWVQHGRTVQKVWCCEGCVGWAGGGTGRRQVMRQAI